MRPTTAIHDNVFDFDYLLHPGAKFEHPRDVVSHPGLSLGEKRGILASWASDASAIASSLRKLDGGPRHPPGGKPMRLRSAERCAAA
jgi:hypothetical protein